MLKLVFVAVMLKVAMAVSVVDGTGLVDAGVNGSISGGSSIKGDIIGMRVLLMVLGMVMKILLVML